MVIFPLCRRLECLSTETIIVSLCYPETIEPDSTWRRIMVICHLCYPETIESDSMQRQIMVIHHLCYPETIESDSTRRQIMVIRHLCYPETIESDSTQRQIMVIRHPCQLETSESVGTWRLSWSSATLANQRQASQLVRRDYHGHLFHCFQSTYKRVHWHVETIMVIHFIVFKTIEVPLAI